VTFESARRQVQAVTAGAPAAAASQALAPSAPAAAPIAAPAAPGAAPPAAGPVAVTGNIAAPPALTRTEWQPPVARTEAAARSGMALYGVAGLTPAFTAISADGRVVRTMYFLESGALLEMEQQRATPDRPLDLAAQAAQARSAVASQRPEGLAADAAEPQQRTWSTVRGNVRVTLRTPSAATDLEALGMRLRLD
jgi:2-oxoglutarate dehydrogenase E2 component (dihydrolipoamide succinyltransferase)